MIKMIIIENEDGDDDQNGDNVIDGNEFQPKKWTLDIATKPALKSKDFYELFTFYNRVGGCLHQTKSF